MICTKETAFNPMCHSVCFFLVTGTDCLPIATLRFWRADVSHKVLINICCAKRYSKSPISKATLNNETVGRWLNFSQHHSCRYSCSIRCSGISRGSEDYSTACFIVLLSTHRGLKYMMTSSNGNRFRVTGPLWGESTGDLWIFLTKASDVELWSFFYLCLKKRLSVTKCRKISVAIFNDVSLINNKENTKALSYWSFGGKPTGNRWISFTKGQQCGQHFHVMTSSLPFTTIWACCLLMYDEDRMMTSSNGNIFRVTGPLWGEFTGDRWIPLKKASDAELWSFLWSMPEKTTEQRIETPVIWDAIALIMMS